MVWVFQNNPLYLSVVIYHDDRNSISDIKCQGADIIHSLAIGNYIVITCNLICTILILSKW